MSWLSWLWGKGVSKAPEPTEVTEVDEGSAVTVSLEEAYVQGYNEGYAQGVHDTKAKLKEVARRLSHGNQ